MFLTDYKIKIFNFLSENFRRLAEILSVEPEMTKTADSDETDFAPLADWFEKTRDISPEQWFDFSRENNEPEINLPTEKNPTVEKVKETKINQIKPAKKRIVEQSAENNSAPTLTPKKERPKHFFSFKNSEKNQPEREYEAVEKKAEIVRQPPSEIKNFLPAPIKKNKFLSFSPVPVRQSKFADDAPPIVETGSEKSAATMQISTVTEKVKSDSKTGKIIARENDFLTVKKNRIVTEPLSRNQFLPEEFSRIDSNEQTEIKRNNFENLKASPPDNFVLPAKKIEPPEEYSYFTSKKTKAKTSVENPKMKYEPDEEDIENGSYFAVAPWIDLPESFFSGEFEKAETIRAEAEHLLYLKREQEG